MNDFNNNLLGLGVGFVMFITIMIFMFLLINIEIVFLIVLRKINTILKRKYKSSNSQNKDK